ncbi:MAG: glycosyltransferase family 1 protein [Bacteroidales bacterium]|nr:glycosyltransferase family 1 protein [Bacteroidales bacterium]
MSFTLHIISFDIPYPANYGGVIDVFYKIRALHEAGVRIYLHCFTYRRQPVKELDTYCDKIFYYPRKNGIISNLSLIPYIVKSRMPEELMGNLLRDHHPILFEGLHTCGFIADKRLQGRFLIYRESNIEHQYYYHLFKSEKSLWKKLYFLVESIRLKSFQKALQHVSLMLTVSLQDMEYLQSKFPAKKIVYLPSFHRDDQVHILTGRGKYALYQGKLSVPENYMAARFLIRKVWEPSFPELIIAGFDPPEWLVKSVRNIPNIRIVKNPNDDGMARLISDAQVNILVTFQPTGLKLKLLNALYNGRFCLVNPAMVTGTSLAALCILAKTPLDFKEKIPAIFNQEFSREDIQNRQHIIETIHSNQKNCEFLLEMLTLSSGSD